MQQSNSICTRGAKYLSHSTNQKPGSTSAQAANGAEADASTEKLNEMYAAKFLGEFVPHVLVCFEHIFPTTNKTVLTATATVTAAAVAPKKGKEVYLHYI